jgi:hypothetical protein
MTILHAITVALYKISATAFLERSIKTGIDIRVQCQRAMSPGSDAREARHGGIVRAMASEAKSNRDRKGLFRTD